MYVHSVIASSMVNGPYERTVIHLQGCTLDCPGCFNPDTHPLKHGMTMSVDQVIAAIPSGRRDVTISGGEPFLQAKELLELVSRLRQASIGILIFSGFYKHEIEKMQFGLAILAQIDVLVDGRYELTHPAQDGLRGSENQTIWNLSTRYPTRLLAARQTELLIDSQGNVQITGFPKTGIRQLFS